METLKECIRRDGPISVADYMALCLGDPDHGYYTTRDPLGAKGDFTTAPEISQVFGELIGLWCAVTWQHMRSPSPFILGELGPGRGTLMGDALRAARSVPGFSEAVRVHLVETSPVLVAAQERTLSGYGTVRWHEHIEHIPPGASIILANEFLDALPVRQFVLKGGEWYERCIGLKDDGMLEFRLSPSPIEDAGLLPGKVRQAARDGDIAEVREAVDGIVTELASRAQDQPLAALFIDYGHEESAPGDTLQAVIAHEYTDPLSGPGNADLTAHVDFSRLAQHARDAGLRVHGPMSQGAFLMALGLKERTERLIENTDRETARILASGAQRLADTAQMGQLFKVMALTSGELSPPPFAAHGYANE